MINDTETFSQAVVFLDAHGRYVARGYVGRRYIFPAAWYIQHAPKITRVPARERWIKMWHALPQLMDWTWLDDILDIREKLAYGLRMLAVPNPNHRKLPPPLKTFKSLSFRNDRLMDLIESDALRLESYLAVMRHHGSLQWRDISGYGFLVISGGHWVRYKRTKTPRLTSNFSW